MSPQPRTYRQLQPEDRVTLASLKQQNYSVREIASVLGRSASTVSRELRRNASAGHYGSITAQHSCQHTGASRPDPCVNGTPTDCCLASCSTCCASAGRPNRLP